MRQTKKLAITQSNYIPWKGYFDLISLVDVFVLYDDMQYTKRDWRNRNKIKTESGTKWLSVPVNVKGKFHQKINETTISDPNWRLSHLSNISQSYRHAPHFDDVFEWLDTLYTSCLAMTLSEVNYFFISSICKHIGINTKIIDSRELALVEGKTERLVDICGQLDAGEYISGQAAKAYIDESLFIDRNISLEWIDYSDYPEYPQLWGDFEHSVTILDLLFNVGVENAAAYMKYLK